MSCDWDVRCLTCDVDAGISNANHALATMQSLVAHANVLAALSEAFGGVVDVELRIDCRWIPPEWFLAHRGHELIACNEYGQIDRPCAVVFSCPGCNEPVACSDWLHPRWDQHITPHRHPYR